MIKFETIKPSNPADWCFDKKNLLVLLDDNFKGIVGENVTREQVGEIAKLLAEPAPQFKVGDWVEYGGKQYQIASVNHNCTFSGETLVMFGGVIWGVSDMTKLRKLKPSEVRVKITLEGQVTKPVDNAGGRFWLYYSTDEYLSVELDALSNKDRELVERLLKAQEEK